MESRSALIDSLFFARDHTGERAYDVGAALVMAGRPDASVSSFDVRSIGNDAIAWRNYVARAGLTAEAMKVQSRT